MKFIKQIYNSIFSKSPSAKEIQNYLDLFILASLQLVQNKKLNINFDTKKHWVATYIFWDAVSIAFIESSYKDKPETKEEISKVINTFRWYSLRVVGAAFMPKMQKNILGSNPYISNSVVKLDIIVKKFLEKETKYYFDISKVKDILIKKLKDDLINSNAIKNNDSVFILRNSGLFSTWLTNLDDLSNHTKDLKFKISIKGS